MNHSEGCAFYERYRESACDCLAGRQVRALEAIAKSLDTLAGNVTASLEAISAAARKTADQTEALVSETALLAERFQR